MTGSDVLERLLAAPLEDLSMSVLAPLLIVDDDPRLARSLARLLRARFDPVHVAGSVEEAHRLLPRVREWGAVIVDHHLTDGLGLDLIRDIRREYPRVPAVLLTGELSRALANHCAKQKITYLVKPVHSDVLERLFERTPSVELSSDVAELASRIGASPREATVLQLVARHRLTQRRVAEVLGVSEHTVKTHVRSLLLKAGAGSMAELRERLEGRRYVSTPS